MPSVYVSVETLKKIRTFINRSRESPLFGSPKKLKNPNQAIAMLLDFALRYDFKDFERLTKIPLVQGEMREEDFENVAVRNSIIKKQIEEAENDSG